LRWFSSTAGGAAQRLDAAVCSSRARRACASDSRACTARCQAASRAWPSVTPAGKKDEGTGACAAAGAAPRSTLPATAQDTNHGTGFTRLLTDVEARSPADRVHQGTASSGGFRLHENDPPAQALGEQGRFQAVSLGGRRGPSGCGPALGNSFTASGGAPTAGAKVNDMVAQTAELPRQPSEATCCRDSSDSSSATDPSS